MGPDNNEASSSRPSFWNVENSSTSTTPVMDKIGKFENLIIDGQAMLVDEDGLDLALKVCWNNGDYDEDPYDDDMYDGQDLSEEVQTICDKLDIRVRGRKK
ncbi:hypothetical protein Tco_1353688 [Tanacetum coccineum]